MGADDHFPEGNSWLQNVTVWEEHVTLRRQHMRSMPTDVHETRNRAAWQP